MKDSELDNVLYLLTNKYLIYRVASSEENYVFELVFMSKNPAYGRHQLSQQMRIVGPIQVAL